MFRSIRDCAPVHRNDILINVGSAIQSLFQSDEPSVSITLKPIAAFIEVHEEVSVATCLENVDRTGIPTIKIAFGMMITTIAMLMTTGNWHFYCVLC
jgi:hypothetical protein